jgi:hypothetical protein
VQLLQLSFTRAEHLLWDITTLLKKVISMWCSMLQRCVLGRRNAASQSCDALGCNDQVLATAKALHALWCGCFRDCPDTDKGVSMKCGWHVYGFKGS